MPLTVAQLIEKLKECPQDAVVRSEGCDCIGLVGGIRVKAIQYSEEIYDAEVGSLQSGYQKVTYPSSVIVARLLDGVGDD